MRKRQVGVDRRSPTDFLVGREGDRRGFFRETLGRLIREVAVRTERRVISQRYFRPPGALAEIEFLATCTRCNECIEVCPVDAITKAPPGSGFAAGTPVLNPLSSPCVACSEIPCAKVCPSGALIRPDNLWEGYRIARLVLDPDTCVAFNGVECGVCATVCPVGTEAIALDPQGRPVIKAEGCVGCGSCVYACITSPKSLVLVHEDD